MTDITKCPGRKEFKELFEKLCDEYYVGLQQAYTRREQTEKDIEYFTRMLNYINKRYSKKVVKAKDNK